MSFLNNPRSNDTNNYTEIPNLLYLGKPVYTKETNEPSWYSSKDSSKDSSNDAPSVMAYPVNEPSSASAIPISVSSYDSTASRSRYTEPKTIDISQASHLVDVPKINNKPYSDFVEDILRSYTIYGEDFDQYEILGKLIKIEKTPGVNSKKMYYFEFDDISRQNASKLFYDPNEYVGSKGHKSMSKGGKKKRKTRKKHFR